MHADVLRQALHTLSGPGMSTPFKSMDPMSVVSLLVALFVPGNGHPSVVDSCSTNRS